MNLCGQPIEIRYQSGLVDTAGNPAHAATYIRKRLIILDDELSGNKSEHSRVLIHELSHFVWTRLGNERRLRWEALLQFEDAAGARGEAGWSAEWRKKALREHDMKDRNRCWREYCCESFCDTAAWFYGGGSSELTLAPRYRRKRQAWFARELATGPLPI